MGDWVQQRARERGDFSSPSSSSPSPSFHLLGYPDDEGIALNGGRRGAREAPDAIRSFLYRMTPASQSHLSTLDIRDLGNVHTSSMDLASRHQKGREIAYQSLQSGACFIGLGGGHDYAYADGGAFLEDTLSLSDSQGRQGEKGKPGQHKKPLIINFDAHLDVRDCCKGLSSGTPFYRLLKDFPQDSFHLLEVGIQSQCTSPFHAQWLREQGGWIWSLEDIYAPRGKEKEKEREKEGREGGRPGSLYQRLLPFLKEKNLLQSPTFISLDMDAFDSHSSPGCSQSWPMGLEVKDFFFTLGWLIDSLEVPMFSVYELSPPLDPLGQSTKLAALACYQFIRGTLNKHLQKSSS